MKASAILALFLAISPIATLAHSPSDAHKDGSVSIQPDGNEFGDLDFGSLFNELLEDPELAGLMGSMMGGLGGNAGALGGLANLAPLLQNLANPDTLLKHAEDFLGANPLELLEKFGDPKMLEEMLEHVGNHELFQHLEEGNLGEAMKKMLDPNYMQNFAQDLHSNPHVRDMVDRVTSDPDIKRVVEKVSNGEHIEKVNEIIQNTGIHDVIKQFGGEQGIQGLVQQLTQNADISKILQNGDIGNLLGGDLAKVLGQAVGGGNVDIPSLIKGLQGAAEPAAAKQPPQPIPDLHKFASLVDTLGGLDKVVTMMKDMGMGDLLERAGGVAALQAVVEESKNKKN